MNEGNYLNLDMLVGPTSEVNESVMTMKDDDDNDHNSETQVSGFNINCLNLSRTAKIAVTFPESRTVEEMEVDSEDKENATSKPTTITTTTSAAAGKRRPRDYNKTRLRPALVVFEEFLDKLAASWKGKQIEESDRTGFINF